MTIVGDESASEPRVPFGQVEVGSGADGLMALARLDQAEMDALPEAVYMCARDGRVVRFNRKAAELWGRTPRPGDPKERFCGSFRLYRTDGALLPHDQCPVATALQTGEAFHDHEVVIEQPTGQRLKVLVNIAALKDSEGRINGAINCFQEFTEHAEEQQRRLQALLPPLPTRQTAGTVVRTSDVLVDVSGQNDGAKAAARFAAIVESADDAILSEDLDGVVVSWNQGAQRIFGYTAKEILGRPVAMLIPPEGRDEDLAIVERIRRGERALRHETLRRRKDGALIAVSVTASPVKDARGRIVGVSRIARDITERRRSYERQTLLLREMNHRIKNLFALVSGLVTISARSAKSIPDMDEGLQGRFRALAAAHELTLPDDFSEASEEATTLDALIRAILAPYAEAGDGQEARVSIAGERIPIGGIAITNLALLLHELATNAAKYGALSSPRGRISVACRRRGDDIVLIWREVGGPPIAQSPTSQGFGTFVARRAIEHQMGGSIERDWRSEGLEVRLTLPLVRLTPETMRPG